MEGGLADPVPNESFDALIDLLGSDDVVNDPRFGNHFDDGLRDADGKLPFNKIHAFFSGAQSDHPVPLLSGDIFPPQSEMGTTNEHNIHRVDYFSASPSPRTGPPKPHTDIPSNISPAFSNISRPNNLILDEDSVDVGQDEPTARSPVSLQYVADTEMHNDNQSNDTVDHESVQISSFAVADSEPLEVEALTQALRLANEEVDNLRRQCYDLRALTQGLRSTAAHSPVLRPLHDGSEASDQADYHPGSSIPARIDIPPEIAELTGDEARQALASILQSLSLPWPCLTDETTHNVKSTAADRPVDIASIQRALDFVLYTDELIWRRSVHGSGRGGPTTAIFDAQNLTGIRERLALWERVVRRPRL